VGEQRAASHRRVSEWERTENKVFEEILSGEFVASRVNLSLSINLKEVRELDGWRVEFWNFQVLNLNIYVRLKDNPILIQRYFFFTI
jgi:hypothetical protein